MVHLGDEATGILATQRDISSFVATLATDVHKRCNVFSCLVKIDKRQSSYYIVD